ncbi:MAG: hypothetical protein IPK99_11200 [Flavobacteriales bacterium]|nr:hypothetical protein [Flavobacteriales bacterium]
MKRLVFLVLFVVPVGLCAQTDYVEPPMPIEPAPAALPAASWSIGVDLLGPASALWSNSADEKVLRLGLVAHHWIRDNNALRIGYSYTRFTWDIPYERPLVDSVQESGLDRYRDQVHALRLGVVSMKRDRRFSPVIGLSLVLSADEVYRSRSAEAQRLDSVVGDVVVLSALPDYEGASEGYRQDWWGEIGAEGALGLSVRLTAHWELEGRVALWARWRAMLSGNGEDPKPDPGPAGEVFRVGLVYPAFFLHYAW